MREIHYLHTSSFGLVSEKLQEWASRLIHDSPWQLLLSYAHEPWSARRIDPRAHCLSLAFDRTPRAAMFVVALVLAALHAVLAAACSVLRRDCSRWKSPGCLSAPCPCGAPCCGGERRMDPLGTSTTPPLRAQTVWRSPLCLRNPASGLPPAQLRAATGVGGGNKEATWWGPRRRTHTLLHTGWFDRLPN
jgi:hypothetical protein